MQVIVHGHHTYKCLWILVTGEQLDAVHKDKNEHDVRTVAVMKMNVFITSDEIISATHLQIRYHTVDKHVYCKR